MGIPLLATPLKFERTVEGVFDISCDGINPSVGLFNFSLSDLPSNSDFTNLFDMYKIDRVEVTWFPEYTVLSDSGLVSNAVDVQVNTAIAQISNTPTTVNDVLQYKTCVGTGITKVHKRSFQPSYLMDGICPCSCYLSCNNATANWYGVAYGVAPTGTAMLFKSRAKFFMSFVQSR